MKIAFVINDLTTEGCGTTIYIMNKAHQMGHEVHLMDVGDFNLYSYSPMDIYTYKVPKKATFTTPEEFLERIKDLEFPKKRIATKDLDVLFVRNNPTEEGTERHWAEMAGIAFGKMMQLQGVLVLNDPFALNEAFIDKLYFEELPEDIKPASIISRKKIDILDFWEKQNKKMVLKPLQGSGGKDVYLIDQHEKNVHQILDTIIGKGYVIAQEFLPAVKDGDVRIILMNGRLLMQDGKHAIIRRISGTEDEFRSNFKVGAKAAASELTPAMKRIIDVTAPKLIKDGLFFVGLDVVKDKLIEINVLSPGGLNHFKDIKYPDFTEPVVQAIERKLEYRKMYKGQLSNRVLATME